MQVKGTNNTNGEAPVRPRAHPKKKQTVLSTQETLDFDDPSAQPLTPLGPSAQPLTV